MNTKAIVMSRVRAVHSMRPFVSTAALCAALALVSTYAIGQEVWVAQVVANMPRITDVSAVARFFAAAFLNTTFIVQALSIVSLGALVWLARETARAIGQISFARA